MASTDWRKVGGTHNHDKHPGKKGQYELWLSHCSSDYYGQARIFMAIHPINEHFFACYL